MIFRRPKYENTDPVYTKARRRLETVSRDEVIRYMDNLNTSTGQYLQDTRKNLARANPITGADEVKMNCKDIRDAANAMLAAVDVLELR